jgi:hypothetical protein
MSPKYWNKSIKRRKIQSNFKSKSSLVRMREPNISKKEIISSNLLKINMRVLSVYRISRIPYLMTQRNRHLHRYPRNRWYKFLRIWAFAIWSISLFIRNRRNKKMRWKDWYLLHSTMIQWSNLCLNPNTIRLLLDTLANFSNPNYWNNSRYSHQRRSILCIRNQRRKSRRKIKKIKNQKQPKLNYRYRFNQLYNRFLKSSLKMKQGGLYLLWQHWNCISNFILKYREISIRCWLFKILSIFVGHRFSWLEKHNFRFWVISQKLYFGM